MKFKRQFFSLPCVFLLAMGLSQDHGVRKNAFDQREFSRNLVGIRRPDSNVHGPSNAGILKPAIDTRLHSLCANLFEELSNADLKILNLKPATSLCLGLNELNRPTGDDCSVVKSQQKYIYLKDTLFNEVLSNDLMELELKYFERENQANLQLQEQIINANRKILVREHWITIAICCVVISLFFLLFMLRSASKRKSVINSLLAREMRELTRILALDREQFSRDGHEGDLIITKTCGEIRSLTATINGLLHVSLARTRHLIGKTRSNPSIAVTIRDIGDSLRKLERLGYAERHTVNIDCTLPYVWEDATNAKHR